MILEPNAIVQALLRYRGNAELLAPDWLREKMAAEVAQLARLYQPPYEPDRRTGIS